MMPGLPRRAPSVLQRASRGGKRRAAPVAAVLIALAAPAAADIRESRTKDDLVSPPPTSATICALIEASSAAENLPVAFLTRLIWKESTFDPGAVSPKGAQGIAQFMPGTAARRGIADPFDPIEAIPASAAYLGELRARFGNLGLAAAAYNAGEARVAAWLSGSGGLPFETRDYVAAITGRAAEDWSAEITAAAAPDAGDTGEAIAEVAAAAVAGVQPPEAAGGEAGPGCAALYAELSKGAGMPALAAAGAWQPWGAQVAGNRSRARALAIYARLQSRYPAVLAGVAPMVIASPNRALGFQVRIGAPSRAAADAICGRIEAAGGACVVLRNR